MVKNFEMSSKKDDMKPGLVLCTASAIDIAAGAIGRSRPGCPV
jgi:hypothetical protein